MLNIFFFNHGLFYQGSEGSEGKDVGEDLNGKHVTKEKTAQHRHDDLSPITPSFQNAGYTYPDSLSAFTFINLLKIGGTSLNFFY